MNNDRKVGNGPDANAPVGEADADGWITWSGGENPVPGIEVTVRFRTGETERDASDYLDWSYADPDVSTDIIAYRLASPAENKDTRDALRKAEQTFRRYGDIHAAKPDLVKAEANYALADEMLAALGGGQ